MPKKTHRGPTKEGKLSISVHCTEDEYTQLEAWAENDFRSVSQQARWIIVEALKKKKEDEA
jgi:hypothetical protein